MKIFAFFKRRKTIFWQNSTTNFGLLKTKPSWVFPFRGHSFADSHSTVSLKGIFVYQTGTHGSNGFESEGSARVKMKNFGLDSASFLKSNSDKSFLFERFCFFAGEGKMEAGSRKTRRRTHTWCLPGRTNRLYVPGLLIARFQPQLSYECTCKKSEIDMSNRPEQRQDLRRCLLPFRLPCCWNSFSGEFFFEYFLFTVFTYHIINIVLKR